MKRFKFRLEAAKNHRELLLELARSELAEVVLKIELAENLLNQCQSTVRAFVDQAPRHGDTFDPRAELVRQRHIYQLRDEVDRRRAMVVQLESLRIEKMDAVAEAHRNLRAMELLEEKERQSWAADMKKAEQKLLDEFGNRRPI